MSPHIQDSAHSVNTLGYAAPFMTAPQKRRGPTPHDDADPRTWGHAHTRDWLVRQFRRKERARREAAWKVDQKKAAAAGRGESFKPFDPEDLGPQRVDVERLCPEPMTAKHLGNMYTVEFVEATIVRVPRVVMLPLALSSVRARRQRNRGLYASPSWACSRRWRPRWLARCST